MNPSPMTVQELMSLLKTTVEPNFSGLTVEGEISGLRPNASGHLYFTLKDDQAQVDCAVFAYARPRLTFQPKDGDRVVVNGRLTVYEARGKITLVIDSMTPLGAGNILLRLEELKRRLNAEGLFDSARKKPLPKVPKRIVVVTSPTGAALQDILRVFRQRGAWAQVTLVPTAVQGEDAPQQIVQALGYANRWKLGDVIILARGGGSFEDLLPFSDERVVRAVAASDIPVVSGVGHETDNPLCDLAAARAAQTPTAAAALVWPYLREEWVHKLIDLRVQLKTEIERRFDEAKRLLRPYQPEYLAESISRLMEPYQTRLTWIREGLESTIRNLLSERGQTLRRYREILEAHNPLDILRRGYAVVTSTAGVVTRASQAPAGTPLTIRLHHGSIDATSQGESP